MRAVREGALPRKNVTGAACDIDFFSWDGIIYHVRPLGLEVARKSATQRGACFFERRRIQGCGDSASVTVHRQLSEHVNRARQDSILSTEE